jgi:hypothetical protein
MQIREERMKNGATSSNTYKGLNGYSHFIEKSENSISASKFTGSVYNKKKEKYYIKNEI